MNSENNADLRSWADFECDISLWGLLPSGLGKALKKLKTIVDAELNIRMHLKYPDKPITMAIYGDGYNRTYARCFAKAMGVTDIRERPSSLIRKYSRMAPFLYGATYETALIVQVDSFMDCDLAGNIYSLLRREDIIEFNEQGKSVCYVTPAIIILTARDKDLIPDSILDVLTHTIRTVPFTEGQLKEALEQRLKYAGVGISAEAMNLVMDKSWNDLKQALCLLKNSLLFVRAEGRCALTCEDIARAVELEEGDEPDER